MELQSGSHEPALKVEAAKQHCPRAVADIEYALSLAAFSSACAVGNPRWWAGSASSGQGRRRSGLYHLRKALDLSSHLIRISLLPRVESTAQIFGFTKPTINPPFSFFEGALLGGCLC
jgi:hypothetical protein